MKGTTGLFAFSNTIAPTRLSPAYRLGLVVVAVAMLLLPLLYVGLIGATGAAVWWHLTDHTWLLDGRRNGQWRLLAYLAPAVVGLVLMFFMVKPILARPSRRPDPVPVGRDEEPALFAFIDAICAQVRAPVPRRVQVDCQVNASAGFMPGRLGVFTQDLVLTIGLPLAAGLSVRELGGVLAHEFGHFAQGGGLRLTSLVRGVNHWFSRVVYDRDDWDDKLERWSQNTDWRLSIVLVIARLAIWLSRSLLTGLMMGGHAISCFMMRQMEFDADSYEIKIAGSAAFARTSMRMREMNAGAQFGYGDLREGLRSGTLPADLPAFVVQRCAQLPAAVLEHVRTSRDGERTGVFDTHPADADRIAAAERAADPGALVGGDGPAIALFRDFPSLSASATRHHYEHDLGIGLEPIKFVATADALRDSSDRREKWQALEQFFGDRLSVYRPLRFPDGLDAVAATQVDALWSRARQGMDAAADVAAQYREFESLEGKRAKAFAAQELLAGGFAAVDAADFDLEKGTTEAAFAAQQVCDERQRALAPALGAFEAAAIRRLALATRLAPRDAGADAAVAALMAACNQVAAVVPLVRDLKRLDFAFSLLQHNAPASDHPEQMRTHLTQVAAIIASRVAQIRSQLAATPCPAVLAAEPMTLAERCGLSPSGAGADADDVIDRTFGLYFEILGHLAATALQREAAAGGERERMRA